MRFPQELNVVHQVSTLCDQRNQEETTSATFLSLSHFNYCYYIATLFFCAKNFFRFPIQFVSKENVHILKIRWYGCAQYFL